VLQKVMQGECGAMRHDMTTIWQTRGYQEEKCTRGSGTSREQEEVAARQQGQHNTTSKGEDLVEVVSIFLGLREDKMGNVPRGDTCLV
jgi:hypothetical protein